MKYSRLFLFIGLLIANLFENYFDFLIGNVYLLLNKCMNKRKLKYLTPNNGDVFDYWTVIDNEIKEIKNRNYAVLCKCKCGTESLVRISALQTGKTKGCPCRAFDKMREVRNYVGNISDTFWSRVIKSAKLRGHDFLINKEYAWDLYLKQNEICALSGLPIKLERSISRKKGCSNITASLDRIDSSKGYIEGNVQWVHKDINYIKQDLDEDYFKHLCKLITRKCGD